MNKNILGLALAALFTTGTAQALIIDDFSQIDMLATTPAAAGPQTAGPFTETVSNALGGTRTIMASGDGAFTQVTARTLSGSQQFSLSSGGATSVATGMLTWDSNGNGLGGIDLTDGLSNNQFNFTIDSIDTGAITLTLAVTDTLDQIASASISGSDVIDTHSLAFSLFSGADLSSAKAISLTVVGGTATDFTMSLLETSGTPVPAPAPIALVIAGLAAVGLRRKANA
ncbi:MAG: hypothetical protein GQ582_08995 [Methyloprofundus sp.]|nr:hypothetical protein [Methyloprofundus sp.]